VDKIPKKTSFAVPMMMYQTEPSFKIDKSQLVPLFDHNDPNSEAVKSLNELNDYLNVVEEVKHDIIESHSEVKDIPGKDVAVTTFGTGSTLPSKYRNGKFLFPFRISLFKVLISRINFLSTFSKCDIGWHSE